MLADIIIAVIIVIFIIIGVKCGIGKTVLGIIGLFVTYGVANGLSNWLSQMIYNSFLEQTVVENVNSYMSSYGLDYLFENSFSALPDWIRWLVSIFGGSSESVAKYVSQANYAQSSATDMITQTLETMTVSAIRIVLMIVLFILIYIIVRKLIKLALKAFKIPVLKQVNGFLGGVLGAFNGVLCVWIFVNVLCIIEQITANDITSNELINGFLFRFFSLTA